MYREAFTRSACFAGAGRPKGLIACKPHVALWGRSNVGKSSLINALTKRKSLVRVSKTPGCTREVNFFRIGDLLYLVDLPGYGYAKTAKVQAAGWLQNTKDYLCSSTGNLVRIFLLIDSRVGLKETDIPIIEFLDQLRLPYQFVLTKIDAFKCSELDNCRDLAIQCVQASVHAAPEVLMVSIHNGDSVNRLRSAIVNVALEREAFAS